MPVSQVPGELTDACAGRLRGEHLDVVAELKKLTHRLDVGVAHDDDARAISASETWWMRVPRMRRARSRPFSGRRMVTLTRSCSSVRFFSTAHLVWRVSPGWSTAGASSCSKADSRSRASSLLSPWSSATRYQRPDFATIPYGSTTRVEAWLSALRRYRIRRRRRCRRVEARSDTSTAASEAANHACCRQAQGQPAQRARRLRCCGLAGGDLALGRLPCRSQAHSLT